MIQRGLLALAERSSVRAAAFTLALQNTSPLGVCGRQSSMIRLCFDGCVRTAPTILLSCFSETSLHTGWISKALRHLAQQCFLTVSSLQPPDAASVPQLTPESPRAADTCDAVLSMHIEPSSAVQLLQHLPAMSPSLQSPCIMACGQLFSCLKASQCVSFSVCQNCLKSASGMSVHVGAGAGRGGALN